ncbi:uncharacterized protein LOC117105491 isoform X2 [Anneissia japonica]|uniref:uncharacterized protein LOC117105491 isoform X2 n=1 Tax=Anneissia japonica TaxID=1529436 RepID=UPI0014257639|nr:uncharacterized protein LOC117105491 isoform X2 [Anneissia japonica]
MFGRRKKKAPTPPPRSTATKLTDGGTAIDERAPKLSSRQSSVTSTTSNDSVGKPKKRTAPSPPTNTSIVNNERPGVISKKIQNVNVQQNSIDESRKNSSEITFSSFKQPPSQDNESKQVENGNERTKNNINGYMNHNGADAKAKEERFRLIPVESWEENEVLQWLASRKMQYFHELFSGCGIDGDYLMQITESDLVDLEVEEVDTRQQFITERDGLIRSRLKTSDSLGSDGNRGGSDHEEYEEEEEEDTNDDESMSDLDTGDDLSLPDLGVDDNTNRIKLRMSPPPSHGRLYEQLTLEPSLTWREKKMANWSEIDVQSWMESINLAQFVPQVKANKVTGNNLMNIDMKLLDSMGIEGDNLEVLLAKIYEINNPMANVPQKEFISAIDKVSGYDKEKFIAAVTVLQSSDSNGVQLLPSEAAPNTAPSSNSSRASSTKSSGSEKARRSDSEERKKKGGFSKLKEVITPWKRESKENSSVQIWSDLNETGCPTCVSIKVVDMTSALEVVKLCLEQLNKIEDPRLYSVVEVCISSADKDRLADRELGSEEYPLIVQNNWHNATSYHFELRQREAQGGTIKIVYRIAGHNPKGKLVNVSLSTPVNEVLALALKKFGMKNADPRLFCLLEVDKIGDVHHTTEDFIPLQSDSHAYVVCDKASVDEQFDLKDTDEGVDGLSVHRNDSMYSQASSKISNYSGMANIEQSLLIKPKMKRVSSPEKITVSSTSTLSKTQEDMNELETYQKELHERETTIEVLRYENLRLQDKAKQLTVVQKALSQIEDAFQQHEKEVKNRKKLDRSYQADESIDSSQLAIKDLETRLDQVGQDIRLKESRIKQLHQQMNDETDNKETRGSNHQHNNRGWLSSIRAYSDWHPTWNSTSVLNKILHWNSRNNESTEREAELEYKLAMEESTLVALKQQQASLLSRLELAKADQEVAAEKARSKRQRAPVFPVLSSKQHNRLVTMQIKKGVNGYGFSLTTRTDQKGVYIHTCDSKGIMKVGDRLYEINGENVLRMPISQVNTRLNGMHQVQLVLLRTEEEEDTLEKSRAAIKMKEELRTLKEQVQITKTENKRLSEDVQRLVELEDRAAEADKLRIIVNELQSRLSNKDSHCNALSEQVKEIPVIRGSLKQRQKELERLEMQRNSFEAETVQLSEEITRMKSTSEYKDELIEKLTRERDMALHELNEVTTHKSNRLRAVDGMDDVPLWEALKGSSKTEILEVFRAESLEASRQKQYLDQLYSLMLENAPQLLGNLEQELDASGLSGDEEFC